MYNDEDKLVRGIVYQDELISNRNNEYYLDDNYGIGFTKKGEGFIFDREDFDLIKNHSWHYTHNGYVNTSHPYRIRMHRLVMGLTGEYDSNEQVDHIYHRTFDNRKSELRIVTSSQNGMNLSLSSLNTSGYRGVCFDKSTNFWKARIFSGDKIIRLGNFKNKEDAIKARKEAEEKYFGEYNYVC